MSDELIELRKQLKTTIQELDTTRAELSEAREIVREVFNQACQTEMDFHTGIAKYDHQCLSSYEYAQAKLIDWNMLAPAECSRI